MAKPFYFWQTVSKKAKLGGFGLKKGQMATLIQSTAALGLNVIAQFKNFQYFYLFCSKQILVTKLSKILKTRKFYQNYGYALLLKKFPHFNFP